MARMVQIDIDGTSSLIREDAAVELLEELAHTLGYILVSMHDATALEEHTVVEQRWLSQREYRTYVGNAGDKRVAGSVWNRMIGHGWGFKYGVCDYDGALIAGRAFPLVRCDRCMRLVEHDGKQTHEDVQNCTDTPKAPYGDYSEYSIDVATLIAAYDNGVLKECFSGQVTHRVIDTLISCLR